MTNMKYNLPTYLFPLLNEKHKIIKSNLYHPKILPAGINLLPENRKLFTFMTSRHPFTRVLSFYLEHVVRRNL